MQVQQELLHGASPAEIQTYQDKLQYHEHQVAMLRQALDACGPLADSMASVERTRAEMDLVDLETQQCEESLQLLAEAAGMCSAAAREMQLQSLDSTVRVWGAAGGKEGLIHCAL